MKKINALLRVVCKGMSDREKVTFLQNNGFYSYKALENAAEEKKKAFEEFLIQEVNKMPGYRICDDYLIRDDEKGSYWNMLV